MLSRLIYHNRWTQRELKEQRKKKYSFLTVHQRARMPRHTLSESLSIRDCVCVFFLPLLIRNARVKYSQSIQPKNLRTMENGYTESTMRIQLVQPNKRKNHEEKACSNPFDADDDDGYQHSHILFHPHRRGKKQVLVVVFLLSSALLLTFS